MKQSVLFVIITALVVGLSGANDAIAQTGYNGGGNNFYVTWCKNFQDDHPSAFYALFENLGECIDAGNNDWYYRGYCKSLLENDPDLFYSRFNNLGECVSDPVKFCKMLETGIAPDRNLGACVTFRKHSPFEP